MHLKYGAFNFWKYSAPVNCSGIFRCLVNTAICIKHFCRINCINPINTSFLWDPWCFDIPIARKPTFINMSEDLDNTSILDFLHRHRWNIVKLQQFFGSILDPLDLPPCSIDDNCRSHWIWSPTSKHLTISSSVYSHLSISLSHSDSWPGWHLIWRLCTAPRVKHFLWTQFHGCITTSNFLFQMNMGPNSPCIMCGNSCETIQHLFYDCQIARQVWSHLSLRINTYVCFPTGFTSRLWLTDGSYSKRTISIIDSTAWFLWKTRCDVIFHNANINIPASVCKAIAHVQEHINCNSGLLGQKLILNNFSCCDELFLFAHISTNASTKVCSVGFFLSNANYSIILARCVALALDDHSRDDLFALEIALRATIQCHSPVKHIFVDIYSTIHALQVSDDVLNRRYSSQLTSIRSLLNAHGSPSVYCIPGTWMAPAISLATLGFNYSTLNLFLFGRDLPRWIMKRFIDSGFIF